VAALWSDADAPLKALVTVASGRIAALEVASR
jgi:hypothetical protein